MSNAPHILVIDDEPQILRAIRTILTEKGFRVTTASRGEEGLTLAATNEPDIVILDLGLPDMDGVEVCKRLREWTQCPIIILSVRDSERDKVAALDMGADDYLTKPFDLEELLIRVNKLIDKSKLISSKEPVAEIFNFGNNNINFKALECTTRVGKKVALTKKEGMLLKLLIENKNEVVTREKILQAVWGYNVYPTTRTVDNFILSFRKYFEEDSRNPKFFHSIRGIGYKFTNN